MPPPRSARARPSGGQNPTLTIVALALRQAEQIGRLLNERAI